MCLIFVCRRLLVSVKVQNPNANSTKIRETQGDWMFMKKMYIDSYTKKCKNRNKQVAQSREKFCNTLEPFSVSLLIFIYWRLQTGFRLLIYFDFASNQSMGISAMNHLILPQKYFYICQLFHSSFIAERLESGLVFVFVFARLFSVSNAFFSHPPTPPIGQMCASEWVSLWKLNEK